MPSYTTLQQVRKQRNVLTSTTADQDLADLIVSASQTLEDLCGQNFDCRIFEQGFNGDNGPLNPLLNLDGWPLLEVISLTNGDGTAIASTDYVVLPKYHVYPKTHIRLAQGIYFVAPASTYIPDVAYALDAIVILGRWGYHRQGLSAWKRSTITVGTGGIDSSSTTLPISGANLAYDIFPKIDVGHVIRVTTGTDVEYMLVTGPVVSTTAATALTVERGYNGSTAIAHSLSDVIDVWQVEPVMELATRETVAAAYAARSNASGETLEASGNYKNVTVDVPKRVLDKIFWPYFNPVRGMKPV